KKDRGFWVMETSPGHGGSLRGQPQLHPDGYLKAEAVAAYALGAEAFCYWLWRQQRSGCEQPHGAILSAWGKPSIGYKNVLEAEKARRTIETVMLDTRPLQAEVAMAYSDRAKVFLRTEPHRKLQHRSLITHYYEQLLHLGLHRDLLPEGAGLDGYRLYASPYLPYLSRELTDRAAAAVEKGAIWIVGPLTGGRTAEHTIPTDAALGRYLEELAGVETLYTYPMDGSGTTGTALGCTAPLSLWSAVFRPVAAKAIGFIDQGPAQGAAFLTERQLGLGKIVMLGSLPSGEAGDAMLRRILGYYADEAGVTLRTDVTPGTIVAPREGDGYRIWVVVNMDGNGGTVTLPPGCRDTLTGEPVPAGCLSLSSFEYRVIRMELPVHS
ncbi:MAG: beta-galactosidase, partial [Paenibacillaceae bacterium]|nr:beta-galactosidase [Paenibacillaceae bacterium]